MAAFGIAGSGGCLGSLLRGCSGYSWGVHVIGWEREKRKDLYCIYSNTLGIPRASPARIAFRASRARFADQSLDAVQCGGALMFSKKYRGRLRHGCHRDVEQMTEENAFQSELSGEPIFDENDEV